ncbi:uncharacterized protein METZ01_LOCUS110511, partial [marine metagenome]
MDLELKDKKAIITGGSRGIGKSVALSLALEGVDIGICSRFRESLSATASEIEHLTGRNVFFSPADTTNTESVESFVNSAA